jgi:wobble nucleotide-excising tRNase
MVQEIKLHSVASYSSPVTLDELKRVNIFYGLNGTGKSTLAQFLYFQGEKIGDYTFCDIKFKPNLIKPEFLVYNEKYVEDNFLLTDCQKGIFTLDKANTEAETNIKNARSELLKQSPLREAQAKIIADCQSDGMQNRNALSEKVWGEKQAYENTSLRPCLMGYMGSKDAFLKQVLLSSSPEKQAENVPAELERLKTEYEQLTAGDTAEKPLLQMVEPFVSDIENNLIFQDKIVGSQDSYLSDLIAKLNHETWLNKGIESYLDKTDVCPFCKQKIDADLRTKIKAHVDATYQNKKIEIQKHNETYRAEYESTVALLQKYRDDAEISSRSGFLDCATDLQNSLNKNLKAVEKKLATLGEEVLLAPTMPFVERINEIISDHNKELNAFNEKLKNLTTAKEQIKRAFWGLIHLKYEADISSYVLQSAALNKKNEEASKELASIMEKERSLEKIVIENQKKTKNVEESVRRINSRLRSFGLDGFSIQRVNLEDDNRFVYRVVRDDRPPEDYAFKTLSEGEKTLISFLYYLEACVGVSDIESNGGTSNRIIVIDDPISSLSFNLVFDVGMLIKEKFFKDGSYRQIFVLTHHLYFLHELLGYFKGEDLSKQYRLFRITKREKTTYIQPMSKKEIKNNYETYWQLLRDIKDGAASKILLANTMRNILEQFFSFIDGEDKLASALNHLVKANQGDISYTAFGRYMDRESHSDAASYVDEVEIDENKFFELFEKIFSECGYIKHYHIMMGTGAVDSKIVLLQTGS